MVAMRIGRYKVIYNGQLVAKYWTMNKCLELIANMVAIGYDRELFSIGYLQAGFSF